jgi:hypothetical protein
MEAATDWEGSDRKFGNVNHGLWRDLRADFLVAPNPSGNCNFRAASVWTSSSEKAFDELDSDILFVCVLDFLDPLRPFLSNN